MKRLRIATLFALAVSLLAWPALAADKPKTDKPAAPPAAAAATSAPLDINTATEAQLKELPGIGDAYAAKIVANRPYKNKAQLVSKNVIPKATYDKIKDRIVAKQTK